MAIISQHFRLLQTEPYVIETNIPGYDGPITKLLNGNPRPFVIEQSGLCDGTVTDANAIIANRGIPSSTTNLNALNLGTFASCWKVQAWMDPVATADNGKHFYWMIWKQTTYSVPT